MQRDLRGRVAFLTGGTSGIGCATALAFARAGAFVAVCGRREAEGEATRAMLAREGVDAIFVRADVRDDASVSEAVRTTVARLGRLDYAINAAGVGGDMAEVDRADQDVFDDVMNVNARGTWIAMRHELPAIVASGGGAIVNVSSVYGLAGRAAHHAYVASKHAVVGLTRSVALEYARRGVRVNALCAGATRTPSMEAAEAVVPDVVAALVAEHPMGRMATMDEVAQAALFLCSDGAGFVTGASIAVDGGFLAA